MNALTLLKQDHANVEEQFRRFEACAPGDAAQLAAIRDKVVELLAKHSQIEEQLFYPAIRARLGDESSFEVLEGLEEHHIVKWTLSELQKMDPADERFRAKLTVLIESVRHHVEEEEQQLFGKVRAAFSMEELNDMGETMEKIEPAMPARAHPRIPDEPPLNVLVGLPVAVLDKGMALAKDVIGDVVDRAKHRGSTPRGQGTKTS